MLCYLILAYCACAVSGYEIYRDRIPNGHGVPHPCDPGRMWDGVGHQTAEGGTPRNQFGLDFASNNHVWNATICNKDSDGDGKTNGEELGDPGCTWTMGAGATSKNASSHPGICEPLNSPTCADKNTFLNCSQQGFQCDAISQQDVFNISIAFPPGTKVPGQETTYMCQAFNLPAVATSGANHLIAAVPNIVNPTVAHHMIIRGCSPTARTTDKHRAAPYECFMGDQLGCEDIIAIWAVGSLGLCLPDEIGFAVGVSGYTQVLMEIHWDNQLVLDSYVDNSGFILYLTPNKRPNNAGIFTIGQTTLQIPAHNPAYAATGRCSGECADSIFEDNYTEFKIAGAFNHMHLLGSSCLSQVYDPATHILTDLARDLTYDFNAPVFYMFDPVTVHRGHELNVTCTYNARSRNATTLYGESTNDEMCYTFLLYYPKEALSAVQCLQTGDSQSCLDSACQEQAGEFGARVWGACSISECLETCKAITIEADNNPCFTGSRRQEAIVYAAALNDDSAKSNIYAFYMRLDSCRKEMAGNSCKFPGGGSQTGINVAVSTYMASSAVILTAFVAQYI